MSFTFIMTLDFLPFFYAYCARNKLTLIKKAEIIKKSFYGSLHCQMQVDEETFHSKHFYFFGGGITLSEIQGFLLTLAITPVGAQGAI